MVNISNLFQVPAGQTNAREADGSLRAGQRAAQAEAAGAQGVSGGSDQLTLSPEAEALGRLLGGNPGEMAAAHGGMDNLLSAADRDTLNGIIAEYVEANPDASPEEIAGAALWLQEQAVSARFLEGDGSAETVLTGSLMERLSADDNAGAPDGVLGAMGAWFEATSEGDQA